MKENQTSDISLQSDLIKRGKALALDAMLSKRYIFNKQNLAFQQNKNTKTLENIAISQTSNAGLKMRVFQYQYDPRAKEHLNRIFTNFRGLSTDQSRFYVSSSFEGLYNIYNDMPNGFRHFYEIIEDTPCAIYFDIEKPVFPYSSFEAQKEQFTKGLHLFLKLFFKAFKKEYEKGDLFIHDFKLEHVFELHANTKTKFSRHFIFRPQCTLLKPPIQGTIEENELTTYRCKHPIKIDDYLIDETPLESKVHKYVRQIVFKNNVVLGSFIKDWLRFLEKVCFDTTFTDHPYTREEVQEIQDLLFYRTDGSSNDQTTPLSADKVKCIIDEAVYTKNRAFRLVGSSKLGKQNPFMFTKSKAKRPAGRGSHFITREQFFNSLITHVDVTSKNRIDLTKYILFDFKDAHRRFVSSRMNHFKEFHIKRDINGCPIIVKEEEKDLELLHQRNFSSGIKPPFSLSPLVDWLRNHVLATTVPITPVINSIRYFNDTGVLVFYLMGNSYCHNIGRSHKSNHVMYIMNSISKECYQKCTDPDCEGFRSKPVVLPDTLFVFDKPDDK